MIGRALANATVITLWASGGVVAQTSDPGGTAATSKTGDPAASSASSSPSSQRSNPSGSGTSTSGGRDDNGDQGRDKAPNTNIKSAPRYNSPKN
ncbi:hypothetical protein RPMA_27220 [Tardiphaga alba]|uniref:Uncharacterized protein n=1 Tax=Tardiphaga alba TaxID=340268 RepID=A0ABX8AEB5_9BRAD|nr:hypothetical protein RPMA_27220 [Tardiphaga alba]